MKNNFRKAIKEAMAAKGINQKTLAHAIGSYQSHISAYLNGGRGLPHDKLEKAFDVMGLEVKQQNH